MKILLTSYYYKPHVGGIENSIFYLAQAYQQQGHEVVIAASDAGLNNIRLPADEMVDGFRVLRFRTYMPGMAALKVFKYQADVRSCTAFFKKLPFKPDVVITRNHVTGYAALKAGLKNIAYIIPGVVKIQDREFAGSVASSTIEKKLKDLVFRVVFLNYLENVQFKLLKGCNRILAFSKNMANQVLSVAPMVADKIIITKPGIDAGYFDGMPDKPTAKQKVGIDKDTFVYLILSRLVRQKSIDIAIKAFSRIDHNGAVFLIVGDGSEEQTLRLLVNELDLTDKVIFAGRSNTPNIYYTAADVYLLPSTHETFGQTILEALYAGVPVVAFDSGQPGIVTATSEIVDKHTGVLAKFTVDDYAAAMKAIRERYADFHIDKEAVAEKYSWLNLAKSCIDG
ncbi:hypothetical protein CKK33_07820 [Mucilaginibacter sp. MD40]|uniref:glycosyltransferase family 4 protein n=1 Tax=Mucilaginibacter sp. MD40 TaxID=2029590 RepID=UPI000BACC267|nr:glycosyltransferase family 4 protein [Mucilaginibacter sp. MD40]PAW93400.1 hypothetical protein CKK33_07820 [Mucilaginibacter sp. MD40]